MDNNELDPSKAEASGKIIAKKGLLVLIAANFVLGFVGGLTALTLIARSGKLQDMLNIKNIGSPVETAKTLNSKVVLEESSAITDAVKKVSPAVVSISATKNVMDFFGTTYQQKGGGTGFVITSDGLIVTNKHVVSDENVEYTVFTADGKSYTPKVLARDSVSDLAILKIEAKGLPVVDLGDSDALKVGQWMVAIGNALGEFDNTVTVGVISAKERQIQAGDASGSGATEQLSGLLQTDAAINPGNSGGPLVNLAGQVIGVNVAIAGNAQNIGFAIPINSVKKSIDQVRTVGRIIKPYLGVRYIPITKEVAQINNLDVDYGVIVVGNIAKGQMAVLQNSPAAKAGIIANDIILKINNQKIDENNQLVSLISKYNVGDEVELLIQRNGKELKIKVILEEYKN
ncbi:MAG: Protease Do [Candidatus Berkelbacteria bacterium Licking1014_85]|uniref:Protease Do n=1 Tax=Candidatus Berkelbacteria bacterium Licking1014_85 TaxID=2017148 RepID=A0A554LIP7_9BACT|nr:MAG: Protease Do [Candidatus Berkelbacteria bacterium Licking1014_85]